MHRIRFRSGLYPRPRWEAYSAPPDSLAGTISRGLGREWREREGKGFGCREGREGRKGAGSEGGGSGGEEEGVLHWFWGWTSVAVEPQCSVIVGFKAMARNILVAYLLTLSSISSGYKRY